VKKYKEKEIKALNGKIKKLNETYGIKIRNAKKSKKNFKKRDLNLLLISRDFSIINGPDELKAEKDTKIGSALIIEHIFLLLMALVV